MPSDPLPIDAAPQQSRWAWLYSQGLGVLCGQATVLLLAVGSVLLAATRDGASSRIAMDDLRAFFIDPSPVHLWFYLLLPVLGLYGLNAFLATWQNVVRKWRGGIRAPSAYAAAVIHLGFLFGLLAHLVGGLGSEEGGPVVLGPAWQELQDGRQARVLAVEVEPLPDGGIKQVHATVEVRDGRGEVCEAMVRFNEPLSTGLGGDLLILARPGAVLGAAHLVRGAARCQLENEESCELGGMHAQLLYLHPPQRAGEGTLARVRLTGLPGSRAQDLWLNLGRPVRLADGSLLALEKVDTHPAIVARQRHAPGNPWALVAAVVLALGLGMMWRRLL